jgi:TRAP-type uncharacterized transport system fused permease subunit
VATAAGRDFEPGRISPGETIAGASGVALFLFLFFDWFAGASAWQVFDVVDLLLAAIAIVAVAVAGTKAMGNRLFGDNAGLILLLLGTVAASITLTFVLEGNDRQVGLWLSFFASIGLLYGGWRTMTEAPGTPGPLARMGAESPAPPPPDPVPGETAGQTPPGLVGEPPAGEGTRPPGV